MVKPATQTERDPNRDKILVRSHQPRTSETCRRLISHLVIALELTHGKLIDGAKPKKHPEHGRRKNMESRQKEVDMKVPVVNKGYIREKKTYKYDETKTQNICNRRKNERQPYSTRRAKQTSSSDGYARNAVI